MLSFERSVVVAPHLPADPKRLLQALESADGGPPVLLIDEIDQLNDYDPRINQRLRSLFMKSFADRLVAVESAPWSLLVPQPNSHLRTG